MATRRGQWLAPEIPATERTPENPPHKTVRPDAVVIIDGAAYKYERDAWRASRRTALGKESYEWEEDAVSRDLACAAPRDSNNLTVLC